MTDKFKVIVLVCFYLFGHGQREVNLSECLSLAENYSSQVKLATNQNTITAIGYDTFKNSILPDLDLDINIPAYDRSISRVTNIQGNDVFVERRSTNASAGINISQFIPMTGGQVTVLSNLNRYEDYVNDQTVYSGNLLYTQLNQPLSLYNSYKWDKKIWQKAKEESYLEYLKSKETVGIDVTDLYFEVVIAKKKLDLTQENIYISKKLKEKADILFQEGRLLKSDVLDIEIDLNELKNKQVTDSLNLEETLLKLNNVLNSHTFSINDSFLEPKDISLVLNPYDLFNYFVDAGFSVNRDLDFLIRDKDIEETKAGKFIQGDLIIAYGLNNNQDNVENIFNSPQSRQFASIGISVPILDWHKQKNNYREALIRKDQEIERSRIEENGLLELAFELTNSYTETLFSEKSINQNIELIEENIRVTKENFLRGKSRYDDYARIRFSRETAFIDLLRNKKQKWMLRYYIRSYGLFDPVTETSLK